MPQDTLKVHVQLGYSLEASHFKERFRRGQSTEPTPYDFHLAERPGVAVSFSTNQGRRPRGRLAGIIGRRLRFGIDHAWHNRSAIAASDVVWTMDEGEAFGVAALMWLRVVPPRPIVGNAIWLFHHWSSLPAAVRWLFRRLSRYIDVLTVHSNSNLSAAATAGLACPVELNPFGVSDTAFVPLPPRDAPGGEPIRILAAGNDWTRDWPTLLEALGNDDRFIVSAWTSALDESDAARISNLHLPKPSTLAAIRQMYADTDVVVVPMVPNPYSGITVALEATAQGRPVIATATGGIPTYFDDTQVRYVPPGNARELRDAVLAMRQPHHASMAARARDRWLADDYTTRGMIDRYFKLTRRCLADRARRW